MFVLGNLKEEMVCIQGRGGIRVLSSFCFSFKRRPFDKCNDKVRGMTLKLKITCLRNSLAFLY